MCYRYVSFQLTSEKIAVLKYKSVVVFVVQFCYYIFVNMLLSFHRFESVKKKQSGRVEATQGERDVKRRLILNRVEWAKSFLGLQKDRR